MASRSLAPLETKYTVYSSDARKQSADDNFILPENTLINTFVSKLETKCIVLASKPEAGAETPFDSSDKLAEWFSKLDEGGTYSLVLDPALPEKDKALQRLTFEFTAPWSLKFSSSAEALKSSFGDQGSTIELPGVDAQPMLYCGLLTPDSEVRSTIKDVFEYVELSDVVEDLPSILGGLTITLAPGQIAGKRNALWFEPAFALQTTIRLQFKIDVQDDLEKLFHDVIPGFKITDAAAVVKKVLTRGTTADGPIGVNKGDVQFEVDCTISDEKKEFNVVMKAGIECSRTSITLTLRTEKVDALQGILTWLGELVSADAGTITSLFGDIFGGLNLQQVVIGLSIAEDKDKPKLDSFRIDMEVAGNFGEVDGKKPVFLASFVWRAGKYRGMGSTIRAELWNSFDTSPTRTLSPHYEKYLDIQPFISSPGTSINLETIIPDQKVEIPDRVPSSITRAFLALSKTGVAIGATIDTKEDVSAGDVPQPYLGEVRLDASYAWGKESEFTFKLGILTGIQPSSSSTHKLPATLDGELSYERSSG